MGLRGPIGSVVHHHSESLLPGTIRQGEGDRSLRRVEDAECLAAGQYEFLMLAGDRPEVDAVPTIEAGERVSVAAQREIRPVFFVGGTTVRGSRVDAMAKGHDPNRALGAHEPECPCFGFEEPDRHAVEEHHPNCHRGNGAGVHPGEYLPRAARRERAIQPRQIVGRGRLRQQRQREFNVRRAGRAVPARVIEPTQPPQPAIRWQTHEAVQAPSAGRWDSRAG